MSTSVLAQLKSDSFDALVDVILPLLGTLLLIVVGYRLFWAYVDDKPGKTLAAALGAIPAAMALFFPTETMDILKGLAQLIVGGG